MHRFLQTGKELMTFKIHACSCFMAGLLGLPWKCKPLLVQEGDGRGAFEIWRSNLCASELKDASAQWEWEESGSHPIFKAKSPCSASKAILSNCLNRAWEQRFSASFSCQVLLHGHLIRSSPSLDVTFGAAEILVQALEKPIPRAFSGIDLRAQRATWFANFNLSCTFFWIWSVWHMLW